jgi:hypothetical protein
MPNRRAKNKVLLGAFVDRGLKAILLNIAREKGLTASDALTAAIQQYIRQHTCVSKGPYQTDGIGPMRPDLPHSASGDSAADLAISASVEDVWLL